MKVTSKGQVTIPQEIRDEFGIQPGTEVEFVADKGKVVLQKKSKSKHAVDPVEDWLLKATGVGKSRWTTDKITRMTRGED